MDLFTQQFIAGLANGSIYAGLALAIVMIFRAIGHINFAQGEMAMFSTFVALQLMALGAPYWLSFLVTIGFSAITGIAIERVIFRPLKKTSALSHLAVFIALYTLFNSLAGFIWGHDIRQFPSPFGSKSLAGGLLSAHQAGMIGVTLLCLIFLSIFFKFTRIGLYMRGAVSNPESARLVGINVGWMAAVGWGISSALGALSGMLIAPVVFLEPNMMGGVLIYGIAAAVVGGLASPLGAVVGGILVGISETLTGTFIPGVGKELKLPIALLLIVVVLVFRPRGIFGSKEVRRV